jgi:hypothetical protein
MDAFELTSVFEDDMIDRWGGVAARVIAGDEPVGTPRAVGAPDLPDGVVGELKLSGDRGEFLTEEMTADDLLTDGHG